jgi:hypothetical protein
MNYLEVSLAAGQVWRYQPPGGHDVAWIAVHEAHVLAQGRIPAGELVVFEKAETPLTFMADGPTSFVLGSAVRHPYKLVLRNYSVHTNDNALIVGEEGIHRIAKLLQRDGKL